MAQGRCSGNFGSCDSSFPGKFDYGGKEKNVKNRESVCCPVLLMLVMSHPSKVLIRAMGVNGNTQGAAWHTGVCTGQGGSGRITGSRSWGLSRTTWMLSETGSNLQ